MHLAGSVSNSIPAPDPLRFLCPDPDTLKKALIWIRVALNKPKLCRVKSRTKCFCYLRNAFSKFLRNKNKYWNLSDMNFFMITNVINVNKYGIRIHFSKCGSEDPDPLYRKGGSKNPDPLFPNVDPRIRIQTRIHFFLLYSQSCRKAFTSIEYTQQNVWKSREVIFVQEDHFNKKNSNQKYIW